MPLKFAVLFGIFALSIGPSAAQTTADRDFARQVIIGEPSVPTCPAANCPAPPHPSVLSTQVIYGTTTKGAEQAEWLSTLGLVVKSGSPDGQKVTQYLGAVQAPGGGTTWSLNTDTVRNGLMGSENSFGGFVGSGKPGVAGAIGDKNGTIGYELDFTNWDADSSPGRGPFTVGQPSMRRARSPPSALSTSTRTWRRGCPAGTMASSSMAMRSWR
jgi:hypothetical protein